ncbi:MAG: T9SS type A sorting domain-containing protein [Saprospiraceae bacterium]|jgi:hypothetical protein|nr:T9SS type A sorting domain-containing protein [Saprospiraceae bacterium]
MKKILLVLSLVLSGSYIFGQIQITPSSFDSIIDLSVFDADMRSEIFNQGSGSIEVEWTRTIIEKTKGWNTYVCTGINCYPPDTDHGTFTLSSSKPSPLEVHFSPNSTVGYAEVQIKVNEVGNPANSFTAVYKITAKGVSTSYVNAENIKIYPNPTTDYFKIQNSTGVSKIMILNLMGRNIKSFAGISDRYDVAELPSGMYIVQMLDSRGKNIKTSKLSIKKP